MQLKLALQGKLSDYLENELKKGSSAVSFGIKEATNGLKMAMRGQVRSAGLSSRLANTWRGDVYPKGKNSIRSAGMVYSNAPKIMVGFEYPTIIRGKDGFWLAIPSRHIAKRMLGQKTTPAIYERAKNIRLQFVYRPIGASLLVHEMKRKSIIAFILVPQVKTPKLIRFEEESRRWQAQVPSLIIKNWSDTNE